MKNAITLLVLTLLSSNLAHSQEFMKRDSLFVIDIPERLIMPANITIFNTGISLVPDPAWMFDLNDYPAYKPRRMDIFELQVWQKNYIRNNNLWSIPRDATLLDGNAMAWALDNKSPTNQEFYLNNVLMNQQAVGNTQLQRMNVRMREIRYYDFIGGARLGIMSIIQMGLPDDPSPGIWFKTRPRK